MLQPWTLSSNASSKAHSWPPPSQARPCNPTVRDAVSRFRELHALGNTYCQIGCRRHLAVTYILQHRPGAPSTKGLDEPQLVACHIHCLGSRDPTNVPSDSDIYSTQPSHFLKRQRDTRKLASSRGPQGSHSLVWVGPCQAKLLAAACKFLAVLTGHRERPPAAEQAQVCVRRLTKACVSVLRRSKKSARATSRTRLERDLAAPDRRQLHLPHCPPAPTQRTFSWPSRTSFAQRTLCGGDFRQFQQVESSTLPWRPNTPLTSPRSISQLQIERSRPWKAQLDVLLLGCAQVRNC